MVLPSTLIACRSEKIGDFCRFFCIEEREKWFVVFSILGFWMVVVHQEDDRVARGCWCFLVCGWWCVERTTEE